MFLICRNKFARKCGKDKNYNKYDILVTLWILIMMIEAFIDDLQTPVLTARDTTLGHGAVGIGSFDDTGFVDDIQLRGIIYQN